MDVEGKKRKFLQRVQLVRGGGQGSGRGRQRVRGAGQRGGHRRGVVVLSGWLVHSKSKTNDAPRLVVLFYVQSNLFCTAWKFAPVPTVGTVPSWRAGWMVPGGEAGRAIPPPSTGREGTIDGFSLQKFFFGFRVALSGVGRPNLLTYIIECVQINKEWDGKLFVFCCEVGGFSGFGGVGG